MTDTFNNPFAALEQDNFPEAEEENAPATGHSSPEDEDAELFALAMQSFHSKAGMPEQTAGSGKKKIKKEANSGGVLLGEHEAFKRVASKHLANNDDRKTKAKQKSRTAVKHQKNNPVPQPDEDMLFSRAMSGVAPLSSKGREINPEVALNEKITADFDPRAQLQEFIEGKVQFQIEYTDEFIQAHVEGLDPVVLGKMRAGQYSPEGHLDLHGQNIIQSYGAMIQFFQTSYTKGKRCVLLIPGRGKNSPEGYGVLREKIQTWLTRDPFKRVVLAFCTAQPKDGGAGALYVLLRKFKKSSGKIHWNRTPSDADLFL
ncbi:Smr/MutS family protein [Oleidesulfovibrio sp.]|uniref:Smr/MutS family protein n=1 Tax=Oleidesulfovibrio sp. TaxID=2909707 RepID=UPI003A870FCF